MHLVLRGLIDYAKEDVDETDVQQHITYFEGFAAGLNEAGALSDEQLDQALGIFAGWRKEGTK